MSPEVRPEKGHLTPEVKMANETVCDHGWDKLYPHFCNPLSMVCKESPLCSWGSAFGCESAEMLQACLINLLPKSLGAHPSVSPSCKRAAQYLKKTKQQKKNLSNTD
jgi:hypothetical protein